MTFLTYLSMYPSMQSCLCQNEPSVLKMIHMLTVNPDITSNALQVSVVQYTIRHINRQ